MDHNPDQWRIYRPKERVRAIRKDDGNWIVHDGVSFHLFTDEQFKDAYEISAQYAVMTSDKPPRQEFRHGRT